MSNSDLSLLFIVTATTTTPSLPSTSTASGSTSSTNAPSTSTSATTTTTDASTDRNYMFLQLKRLPIICFSLYARQDGCAETLQKIQSQEMDTVQERL